MVEVMIQELAKSWQQRREESIVIDVSVGANVGDCPCDRKRSTQTRFGSGSSQAVVVLIGDQASQRSVGHPKFWVAKVVARPVRSSIWRCWITAWPPWASNVHHGALKLRIGKIELIVLALLDTHCPQQIPGSVHADE